VVVVVVVGVKEEEGREEVRREGWGGILWRVGKLS